MSDSTRISYTCTGGETSFPFPGYTIYQNDDLQVFRNGILLSVGVDYTLSPSVLPAIVSVIPIFTPIAGDIVILNLNIAIVRTIDYQNGNTLDGDTLNDDFDKIYEILNQIDTFNNTLSPHYASNSNPNYPNDIILPILGANQYWAKGPSGAGIIAASTIPDPAASALAAELLSDEPLLGCYIVNTEKNVRVQTFLGNINNRTLIHTGYAIGLNDYGKTLSFSTNGESVILPDLSTIPAGWWVQIAYAPLDEQGYITVNGNGADTILIYLGFKLIGANRRFTFVHTGSNWDVIDNDYSQVGRRESFAYAKGEGEYLACDGRAISRTLYNCLFAKLGTAWGPGDGSTTFNIPDARGRSSIGAGNGTGLTPRTLAETGGEEVHALNEFENGPHRHVFADAPGAIPNPQVIHFHTGAGQGFTDGATDTGTPSDLPLSGLGVPHNTMHPFYVDYPMIKVF